MEADTDNTEVGDDSADTSGLTLEERVRGSVAAAAGSSG